VTRLESSLRAIVDRLRDSQLPFALVGGLAVSVRVEPRFTRDADLVVAAATDSEAEALVYRLSESGYGVQSLVEQDTVGRLATARLVLRDEPTGPLLDLLFASSGIEADIAGQAEDLEVLPGLVVPVARTEHLIARTVLSRDDDRRPQDLVDLRALLHIASRDEIERARQALRLIAARGFHRGRDLDAALDSLLAPDR
jgi:hypothetical protein